MSQTPSISPSESELKSSVVSLKESNPTLGIPKFHALLLSEHPTWIVSEKRVRRVLQSEGLVQMPKAKAEAPLHPSSALIDDLDLTKWTPAVEVKYFDKRKGKGLVAKTPIAEGQTVWKEDPFVIAPEWYWFHCLSSPMRHINVQRPGFLGTSTICSSHHKLALSVRRPSETPPSLSAAPRRHLRRTAPRDSAHACVCRDLPKVIHWSVQRRTPRRFRYSLLRGKASGWHCMPSPNALHVFCSQISPAV